MREEIEGKIKMEKINLNFYYMWLLWVDRKQEGQN